MTDKMREDAIREAARNHAGDEYFNADRAYLLVSPYSGRIFDAGFDRGWQAAQSAAVPVVGDVVAYESVGCGGTKSLVRASLLERDTTLRNPDAEYIPLYKSTTVVVSAAELDALRKDAERYRWLREHCGICNN